MRTLYLLVITLLFIGCTKEVIVKEPLEYRWKAIRSFSYDNSTVMNSYSSGKKLYLLGRQIATYSDSGRSYISYLKDISLNINYKLPISDNFYLDFWVPSSYVSINGLNPISTDNRGSIFVNKVDTNFNSFAFPPYWHCECMEINNQSQILIPYYSKGISSQINSQIKFLLATVNYFPLESEKYIDYRSINSKIITLPEGSYLNYIFSHKDYFIASSDKTYKIKPDGSISEIFNDRMYNIFYGGDTLYGICSSDAVLYQSLNDGDSWTRLGKINRDFTSLYFYTLDNEIIGVYNAQLFHIKISSNGLTVKEINNDGLEYNAITSISKYADKVYVSTLTGVYYISYKDFFTYKPEEKSK